jgi:DNA primase
LSFPSDRTAEEIVVDDTAGLAWIANLGCIELHPHPVRSSDLDHPDELRIDLDPIPGVSWDNVRRVALEVRIFLDEVGLRGWPKTSGSRGMHVNVRIEPRWTFTEVRRAAVALSRAVERRAPTLASSKWWKEERHGVFLDYNQNAKDRTTCSAYSVRPSQMLAFRLLLIGKKYPIAIRGTLPFSRFLSGSRKPAIRMPGWMDRLARWRNYWNSPIKTKQPVLPIHPGLRTSGS